MLRLIAHKFPSEFDAAAIVPSRGTEPKVGGLFKCYKEVRNCNSFDPTSLFFCFTNEKLMLTKDREGEGH